MRNGCGVSIWGDKSAGKSEGGWSAQAGLERSLRSSISLKGVAGSWEGVETCEWSWSTAWGTGAEVSVISKFPRGGCLGYLGRALGSPGP